jgi:serine/threonine protein kinase
MSSVNPERALLHYRIISKIGQGGMGQVYKAEDTKFQVSSFKFRVSS